MNPDVRARWVTALRSGRYARGVGRLRQIDVTGTTLHCCLGVLCELAVEDGVINATSTPIGFSSITRFGDEFDRSTAVLPSAVRSWAGLSSCDPTVVGPEGVRVGLSTINDSNRHEFDGIADLIEVQL